jgi:hypothetical protein
MPEAAVSQVVTRRPDGTKPRYLGTLGHVGGLTYSWHNPGGPDQMSCTLQLPPEARTDALNPGRICQVVRGARVIWDGKLAEPVPGAAGWQITAVGTGNAGADFDAVYTTWTAQNDAVNAAITRGLRWVNPGGNSIPAGVWLGQQADSGSMKISDLLNLFCTQGGYTWYVSVTPAGNILSVYLFPAATAANANRILVAGAPVARTLGGDVNTVYVRYQSSGDAAAAAAFALTSVTTAGAAALHGTMEEYLDLSSAGPLSAAGAQAEATAVLARYQRASWAGPFTIRPGGLLNTGGCPVDLGLDHCGTIVRLVLTSFGYGGELVPDPAVFMTGAYEWNDETQTAQVTPFQSLRLSVSGLTGELQTVLGWRAQQEAALDARQAAAAARRSRQIRGRLPKGFGRPRPGGHQRIL